MRTVFNPLRLEREEVLSELNELTNVNEKYRTVLSRVETIPSVTLRVTMNVSHGLSVDDEVSLSEDLTYTGTYDVTAIIDSLIFEVAL